MSSVRALPKEDPVLLPGTINGFKHHFGTVTPIVVPSHDGTHVTTVTEVVPQTRTIFVDCLDFSTSITPDELHKLITILYEYNQRPTIFYEAEDPKVVEKWKKNNEKWLEGLQVESIFKMREDPEWQKLYNMLLYVLTVDEAKRADLEGTVKSVLTDEESVTFFANVEMFQKEAPSMLLKLHKDAQNYATPSRVAALTKGSNEELSAETRLQLAITLAKKHFIDIAVDQLYWMSKSGNKSNQNNNAAKNGSKKSIVPQPSVTTGILHTHRFCEFVLAVKKLANSFSRDRKSYFDLQVAFAGHVVEDKQQNTPTSSCSKSDSDLALVIDVFKSMVLEKENHVDAIALLIEAYRLKGRSEGTSVARFFPELDGSQSMGSWIKLSTFAPPPARQTVSPSASRKAGYSG